MGALLSPLKTAGVAASKAFRRLFGRVLPAGEENATTGTKTNTSGVASSPSSPPGATTAATTGTRPDVNDPDIAAEAHHRISGSHINDTVIAQTNDSGSEAMASRASGAMAAHQKSSQLDKENRPPKSPSLAGSFARLSLDNEISSDLKPEISALPVFRDPVVVAQRAMHMLFIEEALDMVSSIVVFSRLHGTWNSETTCFHSASTDIGANYCSSRHALLWIPTKRRLAVFWCIMTRSSQEA